MVEIYAGKLSLAVRSWMSAMSSTDGCNKKFCFISVLAVSMYCDVWLTSVGNEGTMTLSHCHETVQ